jgi:hypothetical protein
MTAMTQRTLETDPGKPTGDTGLYRWEWRWIGYQSPVEVSRLGYAWTDPSTRTAEVYLVSPNSPHNVKVREGLIEVKRLRRVSGDGLEQWAPSLRAGFPLLPADWRELLDALGLPAAGRETPVPSLDALCAEFPPGAPVRRIEVVKRRSRLTVAGCPGEWVRLDIDGRRLVSLAFEHERAVTVRDALAALDLHPHDNLNYPAAIKRLVGMPDLQYHPLKGVRHAFP